MIAPSGWCGGWGGFDFGECESFLKDMLSEGSGGRRTHTHTINGG